MAHSSLFLPHSTGIAHNYLVMLPSSLCAFRLSAREEGSCYYPLKVVNSTRDALKTLPRVTKFSLS